MAKRDELVKAYIGALDACALIILAHPDGTSGVCLGPSAGEAPFDTLWFAKLQHAELVLAQCPEGWVQMAPAALRDVVINAAAALGASWRAAEEVLAVAGADIDELEQHIKAWNQAGGLSSLNGAYKRYRNLCIATVQPAIAYSAYLHSFKLKVAALVGSNIAAGVNKFAGMASLKPDPLPEIKRRDHFQSGRQEKLNDLPQTGRSYVMPGWTHPNQFPRRRPRS